MDSESKFFQKQLVLTKGGRIHHQVKSVAFAGDPELARDLMILGGYKGSRKFLYDGHMSPLQRSK